MSSAVVEERGIGPRQLQPHWNGGMIVASIAISLLGAFTSTQLMCQARMSVRFTNVLAWTILGSLTFGFCSIWCLHFVAMLACELDLSIGIDAPLTLLSSVLAVVFTFTALASDLLPARYARERQNGYRRSRKDRATKEIRGCPSLITQEGSSKPLLDHMDQDGEDWRNHDEDFDGQIGSRRESALELNGNASDGVHTPSEAPPKSPPLADNDDVMYESEPLLRPSVSNHSSDAPTTNRDSEMYLRPILTKRLSEQRRSSESIRGSSSEYSTSQRSSSLPASNSSSYRFGNLMSIAYRGTSPAKNVFMATGEALCRGCTIKNVIKAFVWSLAITSMHYVGISALRIPDGYFTLDLGFVIFSAMISWIVCLVGCILMSQIETNLAQQCVFSVVASTGVAAMHFTGVYIHCSA